MIKVAYNVKEWDNEGTCYRQRVTMDKCYFDVFYNKIYEERMKRGLDKVKMLLTSEEMYDKAYLTTPKVVGGLSFLNNTQTRFLSEVFDIDRLKLDRNTFIKVKEVV